MATGEARGYFNPPEGDFDFYDVDGSIIKETEHALGADLVGMCGLSTYVGCDLLAAAKPFDSSSWAGADAFEAFMAATVASKHWPLVPVCLIRDAGGGQPQSVATLAAFGTAAAAGTDWLVRYIDWGRDYPRPVRPAQLRALLSGYRVEHRRPEGDEDEFLASARRALQARRPDVDWQGATAIGKVRVRNAEGTETTEPDTVVVVRAEDQRVPWIDVLPGLVWFDENKQIKFVGGGGSMAMSEPLSLDARSEADFFRSAAQRLGCSAETSRWFGTGLSLARRDLGPLALLECARTNEIGQKYMVQGLFKIPPLVDER